MTNPFDGRDVRNTEYTFKEYVTQQILWGERTFGPGYRTNGVLQHIEKEIEEVRAEPHDLEEWIDLIVLSVDGAWRSIHRDLREVLPEEAVAEMVVACLWAKLMKNKARTWPDWRERSEDEAIEHDRSQEV